MVPDNSHDLNPQDDKSNKESFSKVLLKVLPGEIAQAFAWFIIGVIIFFIMFIASILGAIFIPFIIKLYNWTFASSCGAIIIASNKFF